MKKTYSQKTKTTAKQISSKTLYAADMFSRLTPDIQKSIIDLIKYLLSEK